MNSSSAKKKRVAIGKRGHGTGKGQKGIRTIA